MNVYYILSHVIFLCLLWCRLCISLDITFTVDIAAGVRECLHQYFAEGTQYEVEYQVIEGGELDINFIVQSPTGRVIIPDIQKTSNLHKLKAAETGDHAFCMDNSFSRFTNKVVFFELYADTEDDNDDMTSLVNQADSEDYDYKLDDFKDNIDKIHDNLHKSIQTQKLFSAVESRDRGLVETNFERVNFWSAVQLVAMIAAAAVNVFVIRGLFDDRRSVASKAKMRT